MESDPQGPDVVEHACNTRSLDTKGENMQVPERPGTHRSSRSSGLNNKCPYQNKQTNKSNNHKQITEDDSVSRGETTDNIHHWIWSSEKSR